MPARIKKERGDITLVAVLAGMAVLTAGIFAGNKLVEVGTKFFPKASDLQTQTYQQPSPTAKPTPVACSDSDNGKNTSTKGTTSGLVPDGSAVTIQDTCLLQECLSSDPGCIPQTVLVEHACRTKSNGQQIIDSVSINCPYGCSDGACSQQLTPPPASGCTPRPLCADGEKKADGSIDYCNSAPGETWCLISPTPTPNNIHSGVIGVSEDAYTDRAFPDNIFGNDSFLIVDQSPQRESYLKFKVEGFNSTILQAKLFIKTTYDGSNNAPAIYSTTNNWTESKLTHKNKPAKIGEPLDNLKRVPPYRYVWYDVSKAVTGNGEYSFVLISDSSNNTGFYSKESNPPVLFIWYQLSGPTHTPTPTCIPFPPPCPTGSYCPTPMPPNGPFCPPTPTMCAMPTPPLCENGTLEASSEAQTWGVCPPKYICVTPTPPCMPMPEECYVNQGAGTPTIACSAPPGGWCPVTPTPTRRLTRTPTPTGAPITVTPCDIRKYGDANCDGKISGIDYSVWLNSQCYQNTGKTCLDLRADFNQDKYIDGLDFVKWLNNRGKR